MRPVHRLLPALVAVLLLAGCAVPRGTPSMQGERTTIRVENRSWSEMVIYAVRSSQRVRLGSVPGVSTRTFTIPDSMVGAGTPLRFQADPIGSDRAPVSHEVHVREGDQVQMYVPPS